SLFRHEPAVSAALAREHPGAVPDVVATDTARGWILTRELRGGYARGESACDGLRTAARIHRAWAERADELRSLGCPDRGLGERRVRRTRRALAGQRPPRSGRLRRGARLRVPGDELPRGQRGVRAGRPVAVRESARRVDGARSPARGGLL